MGLRHSALSGALVASLGCAPQPRLEPLTPSERVFVGCFSLPLDIGVGRSDTVRLTISLDSASAPGALPHTRLARVVSAPDQYAPGWWILSPFGPDTAQVELAGPHLLLTLVPTIRRTSTGAPLPDTLSGTAHITVINEDVHLMLSPPSTVLLARTSCSGGLPPN